MKKVTFLLDTTADLFAQWLGGYTESIYLREFSPQFPTERKGYFSLQPVRLSGQKIGDQPTTLDMICSYVAKGDEATTDYPEFWAIRFGVVTPAPKQQIWVTAECNHVPVMGYFDKLLKDMEWPYQEPPKAIEVIATGWPEKIEVERTELEQTTKPVPFDRWEIHSRLRALCDYDARFLIRRPETDDDLEELAVLDAQAIRRACTAGEAIIGIMRLLPQESSIVIRFFPKDAPFHEETPDRGKALFREFIRRIKKHFDELTDQHVQTEPPKRTRASAGDAELPFPGFPKTPEGIQKWREAFRVICEKRKEYRRLCKGGDTDEPNPSNDDLREALADMPQWKKKPCLSTVQRIIRAGDGGSLK